MPRFKTTNDILHLTTEYFDENWMDSDKLILPESKQWDYKREMNIEDVDLWEVIYEGGSAVGVYGAYSPYAEFYIIRSGIFTEKHFPEIITFYGVGAQRELTKELDARGIPYAKYKVWVENEEVPFFI